MAKPRPAPAPLAIVGPAAASACDVGGIDDSAAPLAGMSKEALMAEMKADLRLAMPEEIETGIERALDGTSNRLTDSIAKVEAKSVQTARQLDEVRCEVQSTNEQMAGVKAVIETLTAEVAKMRASPQPHHGAAQQSPFASGPTASQSVAPRTGPIRYCMHTPRDTIVNDKTLVSVIWPKKMAAEHYKAIRHVIAREYLDEEMIGRLAPTVPRATKRYGIKFPDHAAAAAFLQDFRAQPFEYDLKESGEYVQLRAQWPTTSDQHARGALFKDVCDALNQGELAGHPPPRVPDRVSTAHNRQRGVDGWQPRRDCIVHLPGLLRQSQDRQCGSGAALGDAPTHLGGGPPSC